MTKEPPQRRLPPDRLARHPYDPPFDEETREKALLRVRSDEANESIVAQQRLTRTSSRSVALLGDSYTWAIAI
jgi:hypothetical protein